mmetsp:Transcript_333/g.762  ORF Transcript_333/g.762 Transcript_333/m.762 type:complete len:651 (-) Transcript_333:506-2458(-)|eukprot:CAMPEP_0181092914 /NCGR_PEP_ID=MMETSP1071-20121207/9166_1 /TAXON_ID=35127 /ORGANISM="Thalassiosira sp., Strain NH16" /LENGTH=650 /DNA_ID=CAMNT_0023175113 /DNA_START=35 /DNA_END=1987 /DNA_ORIENTATION=+
MVSPRERKPTSSLPLRTPPSQRKAKPLHLQSGDAIAVKTVILLVKVTFALLLCGSSYLAGSFLGHQSMDSTSIHGEITSVGRLIHGESLLPKSDLGNAMAMDCEKAEKELIESEVEKELEKIRTQESQQITKGKDETSSSHTRRFPQKTMNNFAYGIARTKKDDLNKLFEFGNPMDAGQGAGKEDAIIIYQTSKALPSTNERLAHSAEYDDGKGIPLTDPKTATENCDAMNVIFTANPGNTRQCTAIISNFESYHIQRWMRVDTLKTTPVEPDLPLAHVSRGYASRGKSNFYAPPYEGKRSPVRKHWGMLQTFFQHADSVLDDLRPILKRVARDNTVVVLTCNHGQSSLLINFVCSSRRRGFDLGNILVFPTDIETKDLAEGLGLTTYYDAKNMGPLPSGEARRYGDANFKAMMYAKVLCVLYPLILGYDVLFQDVDLVWLKDPLPFFHDESSKNFDFDVLFQNDGSDTVRYAPYDANSGFYYVRANKRSVYLFTSLLYHSDLIVTWDSHQQVLIQLLAEHSSLFGLNVKVFDRDTDMFPGGFHYHRKKEFMKSFIKRETESYVFHMSWTENKDNKLLFLRQLGEWYVTDKCVGKTARDILDGRSSSEPTPLVQPCCAMEPIFSCHYRDKPSKLPCKNSDSIDKYGKSFW